MPKDKSYYYQKNIEIYTYKSKMQKGSLKDYDFDKVYDYYLHVNRARIWSQKTLKKISKN